MAYALIAHLGQDSTSSNGFTSSSINTTGGDFLVVALTEGNANFTGVVSDSKSNTWHQLTQAGGLKGQALWYAYNANCGTSHTFTVSGTSNFPAMNIQAWSGSQVSSDPFDVQTTTNDNASTTNPSMTTGFNGELIVTGLSLENQSSANPITINSSFTVSDSGADGNFGHEGNAAAYFVQTSAGLIAPTWTRSGGSSAMVSSMASFKAGAAAGLPPGLGPAGEMEMATQSVMSAMMR